MNNVKTLSLLTLAISATLLTGCGDAETTIIEREPIVETPPNGGGGSNPPSNDFLIESMGRLAVTSGESSSVSIIDLDDGDMLDSFNLSNDGSRVYPSASYRYAVVTARNADMVEFIDGGLWREDHVDHLHDYEQAPQMTDYMLSGSRPTHFVNHDGQSAIFYDGDAAAGIPASVHVISDMDITNENDSPATLMYTVNMHGVAEPRGDFLLASVRRDDAQSTSGNTILPDQVGVFHLHDGEYELEQTFELACPDLHGAAQNHDFVLFGCGDGVLVAHEHDGEFEATKIDNIDAIDGLRIGSLYGHHDADAFIGVASNRATGEVFVLSIDPEANEMEVIDWQAQEGARPISYAFSYDGEHALILDSLGNLNILSAHIHGGVNEFEFEGAVTLSTQDLSAMPEGLSFTMTVAQNANYVYVADPIAQHILMVHIEDREVEGDFELDFAPANVTWLGIAEEAHNHP
ncbi:5-methyltetrahydrofolate--homocysteine methyltransferase [Glaciecola siphonariae]|uniref:5-methyltetrahydrofolate--homocysteine methyltransferase n=1 Tax=Glaciecola siphonariae TaxID=521012 RepID=A0ABV9M115_9ALTE